MNDIDHKELSEAEFETLIDGMERIADVSVIQTAISTREGEVVSLSEILDFLEHSKKGVDMEYVESVDVLINLFKEVDRRLEESEQANNFIETSVELSKEWEKYKDSKED